MPTDDKKSTLPVDEKGFVILPPGDSAAERFGGDPLNGGVITYPNGKPPKTPHPMDVKK